VRSRVRLNAGVALGRLSPVVGVGGAPDALAVDPRAHRLYVANSGNNAVAVLSTRTFHVLGYIPTGWYPSGLAVAHGALYIVDERGYGTGPTGQADSLPNMLRGVLHIVPLPGDRQLARYTRQVLKGLRAPHAARWTGSTLRSGGGPPIRHVVYILRENRTYDQILGDFRRGAGDPAYTLFGQAVTPNTHALASQFAVSDAFFSDGEVSITADGQLILKRPAKPPASGAG